MVTSAKRRSCLQTAKGDISLWSLALWWPYHLGLRTKLKIQRYTRTEPTWSSIAPGWCAVNACRRLLVVPVLVLLHVLDATKHSSCTAGFVSPK